MAEAVYRGYDAEALYAQYDNRAMVPEDVRARHRAEQLRRSEALAAAAGDRLARDLAYGPTARERLDLFLPGRPGGPLFVFVHGGYWQWNDKDPFAYLGERLIPAGAAFANIEYTLCPEIGLGALTEQVRSAVAWLWREAARFGYDRSRIVVSGHSAGGHLAAMTLIADWPGMARDLPAELVAAALPISGIYDLEPIRLTPLNDAVRLDRADAFALSPVFAIPRGAQPMTVVVGGRESAEFLRQAETLALTWRACGIESALLVAAGRDHFDVLDCLTDPGDPVCRAALGLLGLDAPVSR